MADGRGGGEGLASGGGSSRSGKIMVRIMSEAHPGICSLPDMPSQDAKAWRTRA